MKRYPSPRLYFLLVSGLILSCMPSPAALAADPVVVELETSLGTIRMSLDSEKAPATVENFVQYVKDGHYNGTVFHRVIKGFMIQGGGMTMPGLQEKETRAPIKIESGNGLLNKRMTVAMARTSDPNSATSQFFINHRDNSFLDRANAQDGYGYAVFGKVIAGQEVVDKIANTSVKPNDVPVETVLIKRARLIPQ